MKYKIAIFDMDGTILDTLEDLADAMNYTLKAYGMPERTLYEVRHFVGNGIRKLIERAVPEGTDSDTVTRMFATFNDYYKDHCADKTKPYAGIPELIQRIRDEGVLTAVVSNKVDYGVKSLCEDYFKGLFDYSVGDRPGQRRKPAPDSVNAVLQHFGLNREDAVYIGDSEVDLATAKNAGLDVIMVGWGFRDRDFILKQGAPFIVDTPEEIFEKMQ